ncbi:tryptophan 7-halogenase [Pseudoalteromonas sp. MMG013]|uniref:tryptophan halogenase family protein n=1 Tax=Pseudoalteromonas sp. MMG013 TaxID=2822687 RepID=UPI001B365179|nr:tryptophan halogenase family protein [Pseudoalteromonas sp. MMG013]MBQ4861878.1 tryptophan 7-halogenase [Pseudoalteromonas sp. MMG013]
MTDKQNIKRIVIVGGGTAGWLAACHLAKKLEPFKDSTISITLVDSPDIPTIGVGEGTVPVMKDTLRYFGISETEFVQKCDVSFKQSIKFVDWEVAPNKGQSSFYHHIFDFPKLTPVDVTPYWLLDKTLGQTHFADLVSVQSHACALGVGPKRYNDKEYTGIFNYAYHLDAGKFTQLLSQHAIENLGVKNVKANVVDVHTNKQNFISHLTTDLPSTLTADIFVDCTGFKALLIEQALGGEFLSKKEVLLTDTAFAIQVPYDHPEQTIPPFTISTAQENGWIWDIGLQSRRGVGYVFSSKHQSDDDALQTLSDYLKRPLTYSDVRKIKMKVGYQKRAWINNCVAMGLSQGFVEPLEATGLLMFDVTARVFANMLPVHTESMALSAKRFNRDICQMWESTCDFIKLHYYLSKRDDSEFWKDNRNSASLSDELKEKLEVWKYKIPSQFDFRYTIDSFRLDNFLYVLYGMNFPTNLSHEASKYADVDKLNKLKYEIDQGVLFCKKHLQPHRTLLEHICRHGMAKG